MAIQPIAEVGPSPFGPVVNLRLDFLGHIAFRKGVCRAFRRGHRAGGFLSQASYLGKICLPLSLALGDVKLEFLILEIPLLPAGEGSLKVAAL